jgi:hypothetical protein
VESKLLHGFALPGDPGGSFSISYRTSLAYDTAHVALEEAEIVASSPESDLGLEMSFLPDRSYSTGRYNGSHVTWQRDKDPALSPLADSRR